MFYYIKTPISPMRKTPQYGSEVISQAYFSEQVTFLKEQDEWALIETFVDSYQGWVLKNTLCQRKEPFLPDLSVNRCAAHLYDRKDTICGPILTLPFDSKLKAIDSCNRWIEVSLVDDQKGYIQKGDVTSNPSLKNLNDLKGFSLQFLNLPYTWGGRSSFGYDCSGFIQMLYRQIGLFLPRDAKDQMEWKGFKKTSTDSLKTGDLLFWGKSPQEIHHVGMYLENHRFIHSTVAENAPYIRVSYLSDSEWSGSGKWSHQEARTLLTE